MSDHTKVRLVIPYLLIALLSLASTVIAFSAYKPLYGCWGYAPAVVGKNQGALSNLSATVVPGAGRVFVGGPILGSDFQGSMEGAAIASSIVAGIPFTSKDYLYYLGDIGYNVTINAAGPSGSGLAATLTLASILTNGSCVKPIAMTGMIGLAGEILPVGGVKVKAEAVKHYGITTFLVPVNETVKVKGLNVIPVKNIIQSVQLLGINLRAKECKAPQSLQQTSKVFYTHYKRLYELAMNVSSHLKTLPPDIKNELEFANVTAEEGMYYAAASYAFTALIKAYTELYKEMITKMLNVSSVNISIPLNVGVHRIHKNITIHRIKVTPELKAFLDNFLKSLQNYTKLKPKDCYTNYWTFEACAAVYNREYRLSVYLDDLKSNVQSMTNGTIAVSNINRLASLLALAKARAISIELWASAVNELANMKGPKLSDPRGLAKEAYALGYGATKYALSLMPLHNALAEPLGNAIDEMALSLYKGNYARVLGLAAYLYERASNSLMTLSNTTTVAKDILPFVMKRSYCGTPSFIAYNYYGYVQSLLKSDAMSAEALSYTALFFAHLSEVNNIFLNSGK